MTLAPCGVVCCVALLEARKGSGGDACEPEAPRSSPSRLFFACLPTILSTTPAHQNLFSDRSNLRRRIQRRLARFRASTLRPRCPFLPPCLTSWGPFPLPRTKQPLLLAISYTNQQDLQPEPQPPHRRRAARSSLLVHLHLRLSTAESQGRSSSSSSFSNLSGVSRLLESPPKLLRRHLATPAALVFHLTKPSNLAPAPHQTMPSFCQETLRLVPRTTIEM